MEVRVENGSIVIPTDGSYHVVRDGATFHLYPATLHSKNGLLELKVDGIDNEIYNVEFHDDRIDVTSTGFVEIVLDEDVYEALLRSKKDEMTVEEFVLYLLKELVAKEGDNGGER